MYGFKNWERRFSVGQGTTQALNTAITVLIQPMPGCITHVDQLAILAGSTAHTVYLLRPLNFTTVAAAVSGSNVSGQKVVTIAANPGTFSTNYLYPLGPTYNLDAAPPGLSAPATLPTTFQVSDLTLTNVMYCVFEMPDGCYYYDLIGSISTTQLTMTANLPIGVAVGAKVWLMGSNAGTSLDPATNTKPFSWLTTVSVVNNFPNITGSAGLGGFRTLAETIHPGDPMLFYDGNATAADTVLCIGGWYSKF